MRRVVAFCAACLALSVLLVSVFTLPAKASCSLTGAIFTTDTGGTVNQNIYTAKGDVYLNGGPAHPGAAGLPDGYYYAQVTEPDGTVLGKSLTAFIHVTDGEFDQAYRLVDYLLTASSTFTTYGFDDTTNPGGEYKVWVSPYDTFPEDCSKTDNFKVKEDAPTPARLCVIKFYDANVNGINDDGYPLTGWKVNIADGLNIDRYTPVDILLDPDDYTVSEYQPIETNWLPTTPTSVNVTLTTGNTQTVEFGNVCLGAGGGLTLGFWSNRNGQALINADDIACLVALNLRNADGTNFDPTTKTQFRTWLLSATATNMAYMLSAQLAAMKLNVLNGFVDGNAIIYAPNTNSANSLGFATVNAIITEANNSLLTYGYTPDGSTERAHQEALKNALDNANNNQSFVQPTPCCPYTFL